MARTPANRPPIPTPIYRMVHIDNLPTLLTRGALHAPNHVPGDGLPWISIHSVQVQVSRGIIQVSCGPGGVILDYVSFYFGPRSPMLNRIRTGWNVPQVDQSNIVYLVSSAQAVHAAGLGFVFTDRHSLARVASFYYDIAALANVDFQACYATQWNTTAQHPDRQEKKQAEFLVHRALPWGLVERIGVLNASVQARVQGTLATHAYRPPVAVEQTWYYI
jgi:ssDNA thymidine ADP-ribosyltransferase, DarT